MAKEIELTFLVWPIFGILRSMPHFTALVDGHKVGFA